MNAFGAGPLRSLRPARSDDLFALSDLAKRTWSDGFGVGVSPENEGAELEEVDPLKSLVWGATRPSVGWFLEK